VSFGPRTLRVRLALVFAAVTVAVSASVAGFVLVRYRSDLSRALDDNLETRYADIRGALKHPPEPTAAGATPSVIPKAETFAQVLTPDGRVLAASPRSLSDRPLLGPNQRLRASGEKITVERDVPSPAGDARLLAGPERLGTDPVILAVGSSLGLHERSQHQLEVALAIALPALAAIVIGAAWLIVGAALRPMRAMVRQADALSIARRGRLSVQAPAELAELARHLNDMLDRIEAALDHERQFVDDASHELRTPIAIARGELELARPLVVDEPAVQSAVDSALEEVERLEAMAVNLLVLARSRAAGPPADVRIDLHAVCEQAIDDVRRARDLNGVTVSLDGDAATTGDAIALVRAVTNLVDNATRHAAHAVNVTVERSNRSAVVEVHDDGPGLPREVIDRAGARFVPGSRGAGLGLAIVDAIAAAHGGHLELVNDDGDAHGAVVRLVLVGDG
jgi:signal transduction histidine kinase